MKKIPAVLAGLAVVLAAASLAVSLTHAGPRGFTGRTGLPGIAGQDGVDGQDAPVLPYQCQELFPKDNGAMRTLTGRAPITRTTNRPPTPRSTEDTMARTIRQPALRREARWDDAAPASTSQVDWDALTDPVLGSAAGLRLVEQLEDRCRWHVTDATLGIDRTPPDPDAERIRDAAERRVLALFTGPCDDIAERAELTTIANCF